MQGQPCLLTLLLLASWSSGAGPPPTQRGQPPALWFPSRPCSAVPVALCVLEGLALYCVLEHTHGS